jgi:hypothetical protein
MVGEDLLAGLKGKVIAGVSVSEGGYFPPALALRFGDGTEIAIEVTIEGTGVAGLRAAGEVKPWHEWRSAGERQGEVSDGD